MKPGTSHNRIRGFSLIELSVVLLVIAAIGAALWKILPVFLRLPAIVRMNATSLEQAETALNGFIITHGRLPCPDTSSGGSAGTENCSGTDNLGWLPERTLGLSLKERIRYGVYRNGTSAIEYDADLATLKNRFMPLLPYAALEARIPPLTFTQSSNGLDFCKALLNLSQTPGASLTAGSQGIAIAYALASGGPSDADGDGSPFDGRNTQSAHFELEGAAKTATYDDDTLSVGANQLFGRLGCATRFSLVNGAARATYAAYDLDRFADINQRFREFDVEMMEGNVESAEIGIAFATAQMVIITAQLASAVTQGIISGGLAIASAVAAGAAEVAAAANLATAIAARVYAEDALKVAEAKLATSVEFHSGTSDELETAFAAIQALDIKGLQP